MLKRAARAQGPGGRASPRAAPGKAGPGARLKEKRGPATQTAPQTTEALLSLGSNLGDRLAWLDRACDALAALPATRLTARSPVYETEPVGVPDAFAGRLFLNRVVIAETALAPEAFSDAVHAVEARLGRSRGPLANLPRTIDIDILAFGDLRRATPALTLPHPRARERRFVLQPLADLRPAYVFPGDTRTVSDLLLSLPPAPRVFPYASPA